MVTEVIAAQPLKYWGLEISLKISINSKQTHIFPGGLGASPPHPLAFTFNNSDINSVPGRLVVSGLKSGEQLKQLGLEFRSKLI